LAAFAVWAPVSAVCPAADGGKAAKLEFSDARVEKSIARGAEFLWTAQLADGRWAPRGNYEGGPTALAVYALLESGVPYTQPRMAKALDWLKAKQREEVERLSKLPKEGKPPKDFDNLKTYTLGLRCQAWLAAIKQGGPFRQELSRDVGILIASTKNGSYNYNSNARPASGDNSNSQYGVLGVWAAVLGELREEVPQEYWLKVLTHWLGCQNADGGWGYTPRSHSTAGMVAAGVASLFVCYDNLFAEGFVRCDLGERGRLVQAPISRGLEWFDNYFLLTMKGDKRAPLGHSDMYYYLYGIERVGLASGYKYFGTADWYQRGATWLINHQQGDGSWKGKWGNVVGTSFSMLFLVRGRRPVVFNKLEYDGDWNNRPRDMASLTRWLSRKFEKRDVYWQIINLKVPPREWHDAPIVYISGSKAPRFTAEDLAKVRRYVWQGGTVFSVTECGGQGFEEGIRKAYASMFPDYPLTECEESHELYTARPGLARGGRKVIFHVASNGVRPLGIHVSSDLAMSWQMMRVQTHEKDFQAAANVSLYVTNKSLRPRGTEHWPPAPEAAPSKTVRLGRLKFAGNWNPEPLAYERFSRLLARERDVGVHVVEGVEIDKLGEANVELATLTGTGELELTEAQQEALRNFVEDGGTLVVDAAGGDRTFRKAAERLLKEIYGPRLKRMAPTDPLFALDGAAIESFEYRRRTATRIPGNRPNLDAVIVGDRPGVIYSAEDITGALVGYASYKCDGYQPKTAFAIMRNVILSRLRQRAAAKGDATEAAPTTRPAPAP
jgi:hypothetical protein